MKILILYSATSNNTEKKLATTYDDCLKAMGHTTLVENVSSFHYADELFPLLTEFNPDFGITLNLAGFNIYTTGEDSILTRLSCPFAHEILMPPCYLNSFLDTRFNFNTIVYVHEKSQASYLTRFFSDLPQVNCVPFPKGEDIAPYRSLASSEAIMQEIENLPTVFSTLCKDLVTDLISTANSDFSTLVLDKIRTYGIDNLNRDDEINIITLSYLAKEYVESLQEHHEAALDFVTPEDLLHLFLSNADL